MRRRSIWPIEGEQILKKRVPEYENMESGLKKALVSTYAIIDQHPDGVRLASVYTENNDLFASQVNEVMDTLQSAGLIERREGMYYPVDFRPHINGNRTDGP